MTLRTAALAGIAIALIFAACGRSEEALPDATATSLVQATQPADSGSPEATDLPESTETLEATQPTRSTAPEDAAEPTEPANESSILVPTNPANLDDDRALIISQIQMVYSAISSGDYQAVWDDYSSAFRARCSFDTMVAFIEQFRLSAGWDELSADEFHVTVEDGVARVSYTLALRRNGVTIDSSGYDLQYVREAGTWKAEEDCY